MKSDKFYSEKWTRWIVLALRLLVGTVFAFSGFVKAVDPWGVLYKFEDYMQALGWDWLSPFLLFGAFAVSIVEFALGVCLLVGAYRRVSVILTFLMMLVMTPVTLWLAVTDAVPDCGCFGDAVVLSNTATFLKNVVLLVALVYLLRYNRKLGNVYSSSVQWMVTLCTVVFIALVAFYGYFYQPMLDFRPYKVGRTLVPMDTESGDDVENYVFVYEKNGEKTEFSIDDVPLDEDTAWTFVERKEIGGENDNTIESGNLALTKDGVEVTDSVIGHIGEQVILVFSDMEYVDITYTYLINVIDDYARSHNVDIIGIADATKEEIAEWNDLSMASYSIYNADDSELKMLARGNPAIVYVKDGKVVWKRTLQSVSADRVESAINGTGDFEWIAADYDGRNRLKLLALSYVMSLVVILIVNRSYRVYKFSKRMIKKNQK